MLVLPRRLVVAGGIAMLSYQGEHRDEDTFKASAQGTGFVFTATHRTAREGWDVPEEGADRSQQGGMGRE